MTNKLAIITDNFINSKGIKKVWISQQLGISHQLLSKLFNKKNFTIDDANRILATVGYQIEYDIKPL